MDQLDRRGKNWRRRWFVIRDGFLFSFRTKETKKLRARIPLYEAVLAEYQPDKEENAFKISTEKGEFIFKTENDEEMQFWLNAILKEKFAIENAINTIE